MPIYAYRCETCGHAKDVLQKMSDDPLTVCPACGAATLRKQLTAAGFQLKGSGWYVTDFRDKPADKSADKSADKTGDKTGDKPADPAAKPADAAPATAATPAAAPAPAPAAASAPTAGGSAGSAPASAA